MSEQWYWCLTHQQVEPAAACRADDRMGPYDSPEAARSWKTQHEDREVVREIEDEAAKDEWDREDERWEAWPDEQG
jgi:hypothetical protein